MSPRAAFVCLLALLGAACGSGDGSSAAPVAVLAAFPAELAAVLAHAEVEETVALDDRTLRYGAIDGVPVVMAMTGIGVVNAARTTAALLDHTPVRGVVVSGVAGSPHRIADVIVPEAWTGADGAVFAVTPRWLALAQRVASGAPPSLARCTRVPSRNDEEVCLGFEPKVVFGGLGESGDTFGGRPFLCQPAGHPVFGCDVAPVALTQYAAEPIAVDMETAAIAREARRRGVPFIAFRAVSDGSEDPLDLPGFPEQFFAYYPLAARNAAAASAAFVAALGRG